MSDMVYLVNNRCVGTVTKSMNGDSFNPRAALPDERDVHIIGQVIHRIGLIFDTARAIEEHNHIASNHTYRKVNMGVRFARNIISFHNSAGCASAPFVMRF